MSKATDGIQERLTQYAHELRYETLTQEAIHAAKVRTIDTLGALVAGFFAEPSHIARNLAAQMPDARGATVIGTRMKTGPDMAAFVNGTTARYSELTDAYHWPGSFGGHPSDVLPPVLAVAEYARVPGREFILGTVLAYEVYLRINDVFDNMGFDHTNLCCLGSAVAASKLLGLTTHQISNAISMAIVPNNALRISRTGHLSMWKVTATGQAAKAGVFAALLARAGMEGAHLPFEGKAGWLDNVARKRFSLGAMGGDGATPFKIADTSIKLRASVGLGIAPILATEKIAPLHNVGDVCEVRVEVYKRAKDEIGTGDFHWHPDSKETADHSAPYLVAVTLMDGTLTPRSFDDRHLGDPALRALMQKIRVMENPEFTQAYGRIPVEQRARVTAIMKNGEKFVGEAGGGAEDLSAPKTDAQISDKFRGLTEECLGAKRVTAILDRLWHLEQLPDVSVVPPDFVLA